MSPLFRDISTKKFYYIYWNYSLQNLMKTRLPINISTPMVVSPKKADNPILHWYPIFRQVKRKLLLESLIFINFRLMTYKPRYIRTIMVLLQTEAEPEEDLAEMVYPVVTVQAIFTLMQKEWFPVQIIQLNRDLQALQKPPNKDQRLKYSKLSLTLQCVSPRDALLCFYNLI